MDDCHYRVFYDLVRLFVDAAHARSASNTDLLGRRWFLVGLNLAACLCRKCCTQPTVPPKSTLILYDINTPADPFVDMAKTNVDGALGTLNSGRVANIQKP